MTQPYIFLYAYRFDFVNLFLQSVGSVQGKSVLVNLQSGGPNTTPPRSLINQ